MAKDDPLMHMGHRQRLRHKFDTGHASDAEEMELLLTYVIPRRDTRVLARTLINRFGTVYNAIFANQMDLQSVSGVGPAVITFFSLLRSIISKGYETKIKDGNVFANTDALINHCRSTLIGKLVEELHVMYLDSDGRLLTEELHNIGAVNYSHVYYDRILAMALTRGASRVILYHNHPVGDAICSQPDIDMTIQLGKILWNHRIVLSDHLVVNSSGNVFSMRNNSVLLELDRYQSENN